MVILRRRTRVEFEEKTVRFSGVLTFGGGVGRDSFTPVTEGSTLHSALAPSSLSDRPVRSRLRSICLALHGQAPTIVRVDGNGDVYTAAQLFRTVYKVTATTGIIHAIAGTGQCGYSATADSRPRPG